MMGTVISPRHLERIEKLVQRNNRAAGRIVAGGKRMTGRSALDQFDFSQGSFFPPTVIENVSTGDDLWREEIFGPVVVIKRFSVSVKIYGCFLNLMLRRQKMKASR